MPSFSDLRRMLKFLQKYSQICMTSMKGDRLIFFSIVLFQYVYPCSEHMSLSPSFQEVRYSLCSFFMALGFKILFFSTMVYFPFFYIFILEDLIIFIFSFFIFHILIIVYSLLYIQCLKDLLTYSRHLINIHQINGELKRNKFFLSYLADWY